MPEVSPSKYLVTCGWADTPHLDEKTKEELLNSTEPYLREARSKGTPSLGSGAIYPIPEEEISCDYFEIPAFWPRSFGLDVGWNRTAAIWCAWNPTTGIGYLYAEHYRGQAEPALHAQSIKVRGEWIPGVCDPAARAGGQKDGEKLLDIYRALGLTLSLADNTVDAGLFDVWNQLSSGRLKVMKHLVNWFNEYRLYRRDENGRIVKKHDHLMDATRYLVRSGRGVARVKQSADYYVDADGAEPRAGY